MGEFDKAHGTSRSCPVVPRGWIPHVNVIRSYAALDQFDKARAVAEKRSRRTLRSGFCISSFFGSRSCGGTAPPRRRIQWFLGGNDEYLSLDEQASKAIVLGQRRKAAELLMRTADLARRAIARSPKVLTEAAAADLFGTASRKTNT